MGRIDLLTAGNHLPAVPSVSCIYLHSQIFLVNMATKFSYNPLPETPDYIRLLTISRQQDGNLTGKMEQHSFASKPSYEALSIAKGKQNGNLRSVLINDFEFDIHDSLYHALQDISTSSNPRCIWVEDICVNMSDVREKNHQRGLMYLIYSRAKRVIIWLGVPKQPIVPDGDSGGFVRYGANHEVVNEIAASPYWKQAWTIQDIGLAADLHICFGTYCFTWQEFRRRVMYSSEEMKKSAPVVLERKVNEFERQDWSFDVEEEIQTPLEALLEEYKDTQCEEVRDRIFAFLSLASDWSEDIIPVDYNMSLYELWARTVRFQQTRTPLNTRCYEINNKSLDRPLRLMRFSQLVQHLLDDGVGKQAEPEKHPETFYTARGALCGEVQLLGPTYRQCISSARTNATWKKKLEAHLRTSNKELLKARESNDKYSYIFSDWSDTYAQKIKAIPTNRSFGYQTLSETPDAQQEEDWEKVDHPDSINTADAQHEEKGKTEANSMIQSTSSEKLEGPIRFLATNGLLGFVPSETQVGDSIYSFWECDIAVVLRKAGPDRWTIVGRADLAPVDKMDRRPDYIWHNALMLDTEKNGRRYTVGVGETFPYMMNFKLDLDTLQQLTS